MWGRWDLVKQSMEIFLTTLDEDDLISIVTYNNQVRTWLTATPVYNRKKILEVVIQAEDGFAPGVLEKLRKMGHQVQLISRRGELRMGYASAVMVEEGRVRAGGDPRRSGEAEVVKK